MPMLYSFILILYVVLLFLVFRGVVKLWQPKVTPMAELAPQGGVELLPASVTEGDAYIQKTSLAADKPVFAEYSVDSEFTVTVCGLTVYAPLSYDWIRDSMMMYSEN